MRAILSIGGVLFAGAVAWCAMQSPHAPFVPEVARAPAAVAPAPVVATAPLAAPAAPPPSCGDDEATVLLPDGSRLEALNGARGAKPLGDAWPANEPWSPIVAIEHSPAGIDWWVHADGSRSTTEMKWRADLGRLDAVTRLARPTPKVALPALPKSTAQ
jgi:hypothetical protein